MSLRFTIAGANASASLLPTVFSTLYGMPTTDLAALYPCLDGTPGGPFTGAVADATPNGNNGTLVGGSGVKPLGTGLATIPATETGFPTAYPRGFLFDTGIDLDDSFSAVVVAKSNVSGTANGFPTFWLPSSQAAVPITNNAGPHLNYALNVTEHRPGLFLLAGWPAGGNPSGAVGRKYVSLTGAQTQRTAFAISYDAGTGTWTIRSAGNTSQWVDATTGAALLAAGARHCFGYDSLGTYTMDGELNLAALYTGVAKDVAGLDVLLAAARAEMTARGLSCL